MNAKEIKKMLIKEGFRPSIKRGQVFVKIEGKLYFIDPIPDKEDCLKFFTLLAIYDSSDTTDDWAVAESARITHNFIIGKCFPAGRTSENELIFRYCVEILTDLDGFKEKLDEYVSILQNMVDQTMEDFKNSDDEKNVTNEQYEEVIQ